MKRIPRVGTSASIMVVALLACIIAPIFIWARLHRTEVPEDLASLFQINATFWGFFIAGICIWWLRKASPESVGDSLAAAGGVDRLTAIVFSAVAAWYLAILHACSRAPSSDYMLIQGGAMKVLSGIIPYSCNSGYAFYPPLYAETLASTYTIIMTAAKCVHWHVNTSTVVSLVFYLFQNLQLVSLLALTYFAYLFVLQTKALSRFHAALLVCAIMLFNYPVQATIGWCQANIIMTALLTFCLAFPTSQKRSVLPLEHSVADVPTLNSRWADLLRGLALGIAAHLKVYPLLIIPAWLLSGERRVCAWAMFWTVLIGLITMTGFGPAIWIAYFKYAHVHMDVLTWMFGEFMAYGPNLQSVVYSTWHLLAQGHLVKMQPSPPAVHSIVQVLMVTTGLWFIWRVAKRSIKYWSNTNAAQTESGNIGAVQHYFLNNVCDLLSLGLIVGPTALNHHYVLAIPIILWSIVSSGRLHPFLVMLGCLFILNFQSIDYRTNSTTWMQLQPIGLLLLAWVRGRGFKALELNHIMV